MPLVLCVTEISRPLFIICWLVMAIRFLIIIIIGCTKVQSAVLRLHVVRLSDVHL